MKTWKNPMKFKQLEFYSILFRTVIALWFFHKAQVMETRSTNGITDVIVLRCRAATILKLRKNFLFGMLIFDPSMETSHSSNGTSCIKTPCCHNSWSCARKRDHIQPGPFLNIQSRINVSLKSTATISKTGWFKHSAYLNLMTKFWRLLLGWLICSCKKRSVSNCQIYTVSVLLLYS